MFSSLDKKFLRKFLRKEINFNQRLLCQYLIKTDVDLISLINYRKIKSKIFKTRYSILIKFKLFNLIYLLIRRVILRRLIVFYRLQYLQFNRWLKKFSFFSKKKLCNISNLIKIKKVVVIFFIAQGGFFMTAGLILQYVITKLRLGFKIGTVINHLRRSMKIVQNVRGYKVCFAGRLTRHQIATYRWAKYEKVSLNTSSALLDYAFGVYQTRWGSVGVKFWLQRKTNLLFNRVNSNSF